LCKLLSRGSVPVQTTVAARREQRQHFESRKAAG
jgi:hypothetical protein